ncbi:MAG TPA: hypothetical protein VF401_00390 [Candidatus Saccharimonadales bacterium]
MLERPDGSQIEVRRIVEPGEVTFGVAQAVGELLTNAYAHQFEQPRGSLPQGTFDAHFQGIDASATESRHHAVYERIDKMRSSIDSGSQYWYVPEQRGALTDFKALLKVSPSRASWAQKIRRDDPNCYIDDIVAYPTQQRYASAVLLSALLYGGFNKDKAVALDGLDDNEEANAWFDRLSIPKIVSKKRLAPLQIRGGYELSMSRRSSEGIASIGKIATTIQKESKLKVVSPR